MQHRWEFCVRLSGFGATAEEAWDSMQESLVSDGLGSAPPEVDPDDPEAVRRAEAYGYGYSARHEPDLSGLPEGVLAVWPEPPRKVRRRKENG